MSLAYVLWLAAPAGSVRPHQSAASSCPIGKGDGFVDPAADSRDAAGGYLGIAHVFCPPAAQLAQATGLTRLVGTFILPNGLGVAVVLLVSVWLTCPSAVL